MIRVLLVDDHAVVRAGYRRLLEQSEQVQVVAEANDAEQGYAEFCRHRPDIGVIDLSLPGIGGIELIKRLRVCQPGAALLAFSMHEDALFAMRAFQAGAKGYITKNSAPHVLVEAVQQVAGGKVFLSPDISQQLARQSTAAAADPLEALSTREFEVFRRLADGHSIADIAETFGLSPKTVANYQTQIKEKLGVDSTAGLVHLALRRGLIRPLAN